MPTEIKILLGDIEADYESSESLPLSLVKHTDSFFEIPGSVGMEIDNPFERISLPATTKNHQIYDQIALAHQHPENSLLSNDTKILVDGTPIFSGSSMLESISVNGVPEMFVLDLLGDSLSIWSQLEGVSLRSLELGLQTWNASYVQNSWAGTYDTGWQGIFAAVLYGKTSGTTFPGSWHERDFRFHVYFKAIVKAIFEVFLGYSVVSEFFDTNYFKKCVYVFGVGDEVKYEDLDLTVRVVAYRNNPALDIFPIEFNNTYVNTFGEWDLVEQFTAAISDDFTFNFYGSGTDWDTLEIRKNGVVVFSTPPTSTVGSTDIYNIAETLTLVAGDIITFRADGTFPVVTSAELRVESPRFPWEGGDIVISSCLHDRPCKEFLAAISQMFNLAWRVNNTTKQVFVEPRLPYTLHELSGAVTYEGFYKRPSNPAALDSISSNNYTVNLENPFGKSIVLGYKKNEGDPIYKLYQNENDEPLVPLFGIKKEFSTNSSKTSEILNPLFVPLLLSKPDEDIATGVPSIPTILPSGHNILTQEIPSFDAGTAEYKGDPTCGLVYPEGLFAYYENAGDWEFMPLVSQERPFKDTVFPDELNTLSFADTTIIDVITGAETMLKGLTTTFYQQYLQIAKTATNVEFDSDFSLVAFSEETFHNLKRVILKNEQLLCILLKIAEMKPSKGTSLCKVKLLKWIEATQGEAENITHNDNTLRPAPKPHN